MPDASPSLAQHYHERTKYHPETLATQSKPVDWANQPIPFKDYKIGTTYDLKPFFSLDNTEPTETNQAWQRLSRFFLTSYGLTMKMQSMSGDSLFLRAAPSAGGLYPAEVYLISRGTALIPAGLYHYQPQTHSLLQFWEDEVWTGLQRACFWHPSLDNTQMAIVTTAIFNRSAWRYHDRAYRRIFLDTGHLLGNLELSGAVNHFRPHLIGGFADEQLNQLLYLDPQQEGAIAVMALADQLDVNQNLPLAPTLLPSVSHHDYAEVPDGELLGYFHQLTQIPASDETTYAQRPEGAIARASTLEDKYNFPFCLKVNLATAPISWGDELAPLETTMLKRRSTRQYSGADLTLDELKHLLDFTYQPAHYAEQGFDPTPDYFDLDLIETFVVSSGVEGLEEGCYYYAPKAQELRQIRFKNFRRELHQLCLKQDLGRDAGAVIFHTADLVQAVARHGDRVYRYLHLDSGHLAQRLNLAAVYLGLGVSGIGGFYDNEVNEVLGIPEDEAAVYITTLGRPRLR